MTPITEITTERLHAAYRGVFGTEDGQIILADLIHMFGYTERTLADPDRPHVTYMREGQRTVLMHIQRWIFRAPEPEVERAEFDPKQPPQPEGYDDGAIGLGD